MKPLLSLSVTLITIVFFNCSLNQNQNNLRQKVSKEVNELPNEFKHSIDKKTLDEKINDLSQKAIEFEQSMGITFSSYALPKEECLKIMIAGKLDFTTKEGRDFYLECRKTEGKD